MTKFLKHIMTFYFITPHAQRERGKVIGRGVHIYIYIIENVMICTLQSSTSAARSLRLIGLM